MHFFKLSFFLILSVLMAVPPSAESAPRGMSRRRFLFYCGAWVAASAVLPEASFGTVSWEIAGPKSVYRGKLTLGQKTSVGDLTVHILRQQQIPFVGGPAGISSIDGTPVGDQAIVAGPDNTVRAHGWCYEVNQVQPDKMPDKELFVPGPSTLRWFYGYLLYQNGNWETKCRPAEAND